MTPGEYLRQQRDARRLTLEQVARAVSLSVQYLSDIERGKRPILREPARREALCEAYGADPAQLERYQVAYEGKLDLRGLTTSERLEVHAMVVRLRSARAA